MGYGLLHQHTLNALLHGIFLCLAIENAQSWYITQSTTQLKIHHQASHHLLRLKSTDICLVILTCKHWYVITSCFDIIRCCSSPITQISKTDAQLHNQHEFFFLKYRETMQLSVLFTRSSTSYSSVLKTDYQPRSIHVAALTSQHSARYQIKINQIKMFLVFRKVF